MLYTVDMEQNKHFLIGQFSHETQYAVSRGKATLLKIPYCSSESM